MVVLSKSAQHFGRCVLYQFVYKAWTDCFVIKHLHSINYHTRHCMFICNKHSINNNTKDKTVNLYSTLSLFKYEFHLMCQWMY